MLPLRVFVQPASLATPAVRDHFETTIANTVDLASLADLIAGDDLAQILAMYPDGVVRLWGVVPGLRNTPTFEEKMYDGIAGVMTGKAGPGRHAPSRAHLAIEVPYVFRTRQRELASRLWGQDADGRTWEHMYVVDHPRQLTVAKSELAELLGYGADHPFQGFAVYDGERAELLADVLNLSPEATSSELAEPSAANPDAAFPGPTAGAEAIRITRGEQRWARGQLLRGAPQAACDLCGRVLPADALAAAHKKPRALCSESERRDLSVFMLNCYLGCDYLYERGYVTVTDEGRIAVTSRPGLPVAVQQRLDELRDRSCGSCSGNSSEYFAWHRVNRFLG